MKKQHWILGIVLSLGIGLIAASPRLIRMDNPEIGFVCISILQFFITCFSCWVIYTQLFSKIKFGQQSQQYMIAGTIVLVAMLTVGYDYFFNSFISKSLQFPEIFGIKRFFALTLRGLVMSSFFYFIQYYLYILNEKQKSQLELAQLKQAQLAANLSSLKEQLSPHFLFNTLNTLSTLTQEKNVKNYIVQLANVYRYVLSYKENDVATLKQELAFIQSYLFIMKARYEDAIELEMYIDEKLFCSHLPAMTLQMLVENAIKHNVVSFQKPLKICLSNTLDGYILIKNNLQPKYSVTASNGIGLNNIMQRYHWLFNKEIVIEKTETDFIVKIPVVL
jgi:sensor histidine kinase YesM